MVKLRRYIKEAKQVGVIYHVCTLEDVSLYIAPRDTLSSSGNYYNQMLKRTDCISFTRNRGLVADTPRNRESTILFRFAVDGDVVSENHKVKPYNDSYYDPETDTMIPYPAEDREGEEVVIGSIYPFSKFVTGVEFGVNKNINSKSKKDIRAILDQIDIVYPYLSKFPVVYNSDLKPPKENTLSFVSLKDCRKYIQSLL